MTGRELWISQAGAWWLAVSRKGLIVKVDSTNDVASKDLSRALRRHHRARLKSARRLYWGRGYFELTPRQLGMLVTTAHLCSGMCCGNPRKWFGERTLAEQRELQESVADRLADALPLKDGLDDAA